MKDKVISYAQNREDVILAAFFPDVKKGFYVDVGAHHPVKDSVTKYFYERGWQGINIEPNKRLFDELCIDRPRDVNVNVGISDKPGKLRLRVYDEGDGLSTFSEEIKKEYSSQKDDYTKIYHDQEVEVVTLKELFNKHNVNSTIHFLKIDIEGYEYNALQCNDWEKYRPEILCIEANHLVHDWRPLLRKNKYRQVFFDGLNEYYVAHEASKRAESFSYVKGLIGRPIISNEWNQELVDASLAANKHKLDLQKAHQELARLHYELERLKQVRPALIQLARALDTGFHARIDRLNKPKVFKPKHHLPESYNSATELLAAVRIYDIERYHTRRPSGRLLYRTINRAYMLFSRIGFRLARKAWLVVKTVRKRSAAA